MKENILTKISSICLIIFVITSFKSQEIKVTMLKENILYTNKYDYNPINLSYNIENTTNNTIYFVLNKKAFGFFIKPNQYDFNFGRGDNPNLQLKEKIFNARLFVLKKQNDTLSLDSHGTCGYYNLESEIVLKEINERNKLEESIKNDSTKSFKRYQQNNQLQNKSIDWVASAKYINDNIIVLKPFEIIQITTPIDFFNYYYNPIEKNGAGYFLQDESYNIAIKIHGDPALIEEYLTANTLNKLKRINAVPLKQDYFSNKIPLKVKYDKSSLKKNVY